MGECPAGLTLERDRNDGPYQPDNCRWATRVEQAANTRRNHLLTIGGRTQILEAWSRESGVHRRTIASRLDLGWDAHRAVFAPACRGNNQVGGTHMVAGDLQ